MEGKMTGKKTEIMQEIRIKMEESKREVKDTLNQF
jgi:hypothetical protein